MNKLLTTTRKRLVYKAKRGAKLQHIMSVSRTATSDLI